MAQLILNLSDFEGSIKELIERATDFRVPLKVFALHMVGSIKRNFDEQGRPIRWRPLKPATLLARYTRGNRERKNKRSSYKDVGGSSRFTSAVAMGNGGVAVARPGKTFTAGAARAVMQGKILQDRGTLRSSISSQVSNLQMRVGTNLEYAGVHQRGNAAKGIPARPYLVVQAEDVMEFRELMVRHLRGEAL